MNNPDHISQSSETIFVLKYLHFFIQMRDPGWKKFGPGIRDKHLGSATLVTTWIVLQVFSAGGRREPSSLYRAGSSSLSYLPYFEMADLGGSGPYIVSTFLQSCHWLFQCCGSEDGTLVGIFSGSGTIIDLAWDPDRDPVLWWKKRIQLDKYCCLSDMVPVCT